MNPIIGLNDYLQRVGARLKRLRLWRGLAALAAAALLVTVLGVYFALRSGFTGAVVNGARAVLVVALIAIIIGLIVAPIRKLKGQGAVREIEARTPEFQGRVATYVSTQEQKNPLRELLAEDTLKLAEQFPPERQIRRRELRIPAIAAAVCALVLLWLAAAGPGLWSYGARYLWAGWAMPNLKPSQSINVTPGDQTVRRGGNVPILAKAAGFAPTGARMHVQLEDGSWQEVDMTPADEGFAFTFFSVREPTQYYVSAAGVRSANYKLSVVDVPNIQDLKLTYHYPKWTGRADETQDPGGDIRAIKDTAVDLDLTADAPLPQTELVLDDKPSSLPTDGAQAHTHIDVQKDGRYYVAARIGGDKVRLTDDYFIKVVDDAPPELRVVRPGRDYGASSIEEVTARVDANDDFGLESLELRYSVNGGKWQSVKLPQNKTGDNGAVEAEHVFALESLGKEANANLKPGDLVSYYAVAKDHTQTVRTDMFFIDVKPFDRRFTQSQQSGGGGGQGQGSEQSEISQRQKEIIVSTWNLIREQGKREDEGKVKDNAALLSELQTKLAAQATTLAQRLQSRELSTDDEQIKKFSESMKEAVAAMKPAAEHLAGVELDDAIQPEQLALQHLLRAESVFTDIQIAMQQGGGGGGAQDSRDLAQMYELEMDLNKNQYETANSASPEATNENADDLSRKLKELARRQEQLANDAKQQQQLTQEQRWQQESLRREAEELKRRVERLQQQMANQRSSQQGNQQNGQQSGQSSGQASSSSQASAGNQSNELSQRLESAIRAMNESSEAMRNGSDAGERNRAERAASEAQRQLTSARDALTRDQQSALQNSLGNMADRAAGLYENQAQFDRSLQDAVRQQRSQGGAESAAGSSAKQLADEKRDIATKLQKLQTEMLTAARNLKQQAPQTSQALTDANKKLEDNDIDRRLAVAANYIQNGGAPFVVASESAVTDSLRDLRDDLRRAAGAGGKGQAREDKVDDALARVRALRQELQQLADASAQGGQRDGQQGSPNARSGNQQANGQPGNGQQSNAQPSNGQPGKAGGQSGQSNSQSGGGAQANAQGANGQSRNGQATAGAQAGGANNGAPGLGGGSVWGGGAPNNSNFTGGPSALRPGFREDLNTTAREARAAIGDLSNRGQLTQQEAQRLQEITRQLEAGNKGGDAKRMNGESNASLALLEQLELKLAQSSERRNGKDNVRTAIAEPVPNEYEDAVAEYYRKLSKD